MRHFNIVFLVSIFALMISCSQKVDNSAEKWTTIDRWLELWNKQNLAIADEILATDFISHIPQFPNVNNLDSYREEIEKTGNQIPDFHTTLEDLIVERNKVAGRFTATGTPQGELMGMSANNTKYTNTWIVIFHFTDGKISQEWWQFDMLGVLQQLGIMAPAQNGPPALQRADPEDFVWGPPSKVTGDPGDPESNKVLILRENEVWNQVGVDKLKKELDEIYSPDFVYHDPARPHVTDLVSYKRWAVEEVLTPFPNFTLHTDDILAEEDKVATRWTFSGTNMSSGKTVTQTGQSIYRIADGRIVEAWCDFDMLGTIQQMKGMDKR